MTRRIQWGQDEFKAIQDAIESNLLPGGTFIDVGAHSGQETIPVAKYLGVTGRVYSFEPNDASFVQLEENIRKEGLENIVLSKLAIADMQGEAKFYGSPLSEVSTIIDAAAVDNGQINIVKTEKLDNLFSEIHVDCIKIDVQGAEPKVLVGAEQVLKKCMPALIMEWECIPNASSIWAFHFLTDLGYIIYDINAHKKIVEQPKDMFCPRMFKTRTNLLCKKK